MIEVAIMIVVVQKSELSEVVQSGLKWSEEMQVCGMYNE